MYINLKNHCLNFVKIKEKYIHRKKLLKTLGFNMDEMSIHRLKSNKSINFL